MADNVNNKRESVFSLILGVFGNRYFILGLIFCIFGSIILYMTAALQFSGYQRTISASSEGVSRQYVVTAPRGDIIDANGVVLATSQEVNTVMISNAYMENADLNAMCLELSYLFDQYNCISESELDEYFAVNPFQFLQASAELHRISVTDATLADIGFNQPL